MSTPSLVISSPPAFPSSASATSQPEVMRSIPTFADGRTTTPALAAPSGPTMPVVRSIALVIVEPAGPSIEGSGWWNVSRCATSAGSAGA